MQFKKKLIYSGIASSLALITSILIPIIPCKISPKIPNPIHKWTVCSLNPDIIKSSGSLREYFGYTTLLTESYILVMLITFVVVMIFFHFTTRKKKN